MRNPIRPIVVKGSELDPAQAISLGRLFVAMMRRFAPNGEVTFTPSELDIGGALTVFEPTPEGGVRLHLSHIDVVDGQDA